MVSGIPARLRGVVLVSLCMNAVHRKRGFICTVTSVLPVLVVARNGAEKCMAIPLVNGMLYGNGACSSMVGVTVRLPIVVPNRGPMAVGLHKSCLFWQFDGFCQLATTKQSFRHELMRMASPICSAVECLSGAGHVSLETDFVGNLVSDGFNPSKMKS